MNRNIIEPSENPAVSRRAEIIDYGEKDFRTYWQGKSKGLLHESEEAIVKKLMPVKSKWFIDIGCGFGRLMPIYQSEKKHLVLLDYDVKHLKMAAETATRSNVNYVASDACRLPFRDEIFDGGICVRLVHHIARPEVLMSEIYRVLTSSSSMLFNYMNRRNMLRICRYGADCFRHTHEKVSDIIFATHPAYYTGIAVKAGFKVSSVRGTGLVHQMVHESAAFAKFAESSSVIGKLLSAGEHVADPILGRLNLALMQYTRLEKNDRQLPVRETAEPDNFLDTLRCSACGCVDLKEVCDGLQCSECDHVFIKDGQVYDFRCVR